jgi:hypothetical protein
VKSTLPDDGESRRKGSNGSEEMIGLNGSLWLPSSCQAPGENPYCGIDDGGVMRSYLFGGVVVEPRVIWVPGVFGSIRFFVVFLLIFDLLCFVKRISSSPCISLAVVALFIKRGESLIRENDGESRRKTEKRRAGSEEDRRAAGRISGEGADGGGNNGESAGTEKILQRGATAEARAPPPRRRSTLDVCKQYPVLVAAATDGSRK